MNTIHPTAFVGDEVNLGHGNVIGAYAVLLGPLHVGDGNWIGAQTVIGSPGEIRGIDHGDGAGAIGRGIRIGSGNVIREHVTIHQGHYARTIIGDECYIMNRVYIGHDGELADRVTMASAVTLGGHVHVGADANLGMGALVHQRRVIGPATMIGMGAVVTRDVPPFAKAYGNPSRVRGANRVGMQRQGISETTIQTLEEAYAMRGAAPAGVPPGLEAAWHWWRAETNRDDADPG
ncbi:MAG TPA: UDP-N-acetylglucosamine acyltransferase [Jatrophihabitans sp.]|nr:UDP-N-acetylglucosamine acyltransferase [Jatrophihabitans sp.]